ncbi:MAG: saccharopine dehydrogenase NADP-binding domain-containing protein [bacterium]|nr:saccharopine dehydrogenase NADP-binding domain-containing protein [bacterium]
MASDNKNKKILLLGAGLVTRPLVNYLLDIPGFTLTIATRTATKAFALIGNRKNGFGEYFDIETNPDALDGLVKKHDLVISLLPAMHHPTVAKAAIKNKKLMLTTSYVSPAMKALDQDAKDAGILIMNEIGLDPGIDHMSAMRVIHGVRKNGGKVTSFRSYCGGLPAPEANTNPFGYKFSWSPRGVVLAARNSAKYLENGKIVEIPGEDLFDHFHYVKLDELKDGFEAYANRDSIPYIDVYGLKDAHTMYRGTFRNLGHCVTWKKLADLGLFEVEVMSSLEGMSYRDFMAMLTDVPNDANLENAIVKKLNIPSDPPVIEKWTWLGLFDNTKPIPKPEMSPLDVLVAIFLEKLQYEPGERDMVVLHHIFEAEYPDRKEKITSTLLDFGIPNGDTSMARTVGLPAAVAVRMMLQGEMNMTGVHVPVIPEIYNPVLNELETLGIKCKERVIPI